MQLALELRELRSGHAELDGPLRLRCPRRREFRLGVLEKCRASSLGLRHRTRDGGRDDRVRPLLRLLLGIGCVLLVRMQVRRGVLLRDRRLPLRPFARHRFLSCRRRGRRLVRQPLGPACRSLSALRIDARRLRLGSQGRPLGSQLIELPDGRRQVARERVRTVRRAGRLMASRCDLLQRGPSRRRRLLGRRQTRGPRCLGRSLALRGGRLVLRALHVVARLAKLARGVLREGLDPVSFRPLVNHRSLSFLARSMQLGQLRALPLHLAARLVSACPCAGLVGLGCAQQLPQLAELRAELRVLHLLARERLTQQLVAPSHPCTRRGRPLICGLEAHSCLGKLGCELLATCLGRSRPLVRRLRARGRLGKRLGSLCLHPLH